MVIRFQVDPDFYDHPKSIGMSDSATALWVRAGSYSAAKLLDGFVAEHVVSLLSTVPDEAASELVARGLWRRVRGGFRFHQWDRRNLTRARVEADQEADRKRKRRERKEARENTSPSEVVHSLWTTPGGRGHGDEENTSPQVNPNIVHPDSRPDSTRSPPGVRPVSVSVSVSGSVSGSGRDASEPPRRCPQHVHNPNPPPCGACGDHRRAYETWQANRTARQRHAPRCPKHAGQLAESCANCAGDAKAATHEESA